MALKVYSISTHKFIRMDLPASRIERNMYESYAGADDYTIWLDATRGSLQVINTAADFQTVAEAEGALKSYETLCASPPVAVVWDDISQPFTVKIHDVRGRIMPLVFSVGGLTADAGNIGRALLVAQWQILPMPIVP